MVSGSSRRSRTLVNSFTGKMSSPVKARATFTRSASVIIAYWDRIAKLRVHDVRRVSAKISVTAYSPLAAMVLEHW